MSVSHLKLQQKQHWSEKKKKKKENSLNMTEQNDPGI